MQHTEATSILKEYYEGKELTGEVRVYEDKVNKLMKLPTDQLRMHVEKIGTAVRVLKELDSPSIGTNNNLSAGIIVLDRLRDALNKHPDVIRKKAEENRIREEANRKAEEEKKRTALELQRKYKNMRIPKVLHVIACIAAFVGLVEEIITMDVGLGAFGGFAIAIAIHSFLLFCSADGNGKAFPAIIYFVIIFAWCVAVVVLAHTALEGGEATMFYFASFVAYAGLSAVAAIIAFINSIRKG